MSIENRRLLLRAGASALLGGTYKMFSADIVSAQGRGSTPKDSPSSEPKPKTTPEALGFIALEVTAIGAVAAAMIYGIPIIDRLKRRGKK